ncbi:MAG: hypothetical protein SXV54_18040 [Chloroflexota bacterium]|nr:hypothetical protein [Chloroflexota bacterium]
MSELTCRICKTTPTTRGYLLALQEVDLVVERGGMYFYPDPVLRYWAAYATWGGEAGPFATRTVLAPLLADLQARHSRLTTTADHGILISTRADLEKLERQLSES